MTYSNPYVQYVLLRAKLHIKFYNKLRFVAGAANVEHACRNIYGIVKRLTTVCEL